MNNHIEAALDWAERNQERRERDRARMVPSINHEGQVYEVGSDGEPVDTRQRERLMAMAQYRANAEVKRGIDRHNKDVHFSQRLEMRDATEKEAEFTYRHFLEAGKYRAEHRQSSEVALDLGDVVNGELG